MISQLSIEAVPAGGLGLLRDTQVVAAGGDQGVPALASDQLAVDPSGAGRLMGSEAGMPMGLPNV